MCSGSVKDTLPGRLEPVSRTALDNRQFVYEVLWITVA